MFAWVKILISLAGECFVQTTVNLEIFVVKIFSYSFKATKINIPKIFVQWFKTVKCFLQWMNEPAKWLWYEILVHLLWCWSIVNSLVHKWAPLFQHALRSHASLYSFEYASAILVVHFVWQPTSRLLRLMLIFFCISGTNGTRMY